jgi:hypothetical protein
MRGPDHAVTDPTKAFADWDEAVSHLLYLGEVTLTSEQLSVILMFASLHGSTNDFYYTAYMRLNDSRGVEGRRARQSIAIDQNGTRFVTHVVTYRSSDPVRHTPP